MKIDSTPLHHLSEDHKSRIKIDNYGITDNNDIVSYTGAENGKILTAQQYGATSPSSTIKPRCYLSDTTYCTMEDYIMASKWLTDTGAKQLSLPYRLGVYAIPEEKQSDVSSSTRVKSNWCIIYEDGDVMNYRDDNIRLVPLAEYCAWCDKYHRRRILNSRHKDDIRELCSKFQTNGINHFTYSTVAKRLNMSYKLVWTIVTGNQYY